MKASPCASAKEENLRYIACRSMPRKPCLPLHVNFLFLSRNDQTQSSPVGGTPLTQISRVALIAPAARRGLGPPGLSPGGHPLAPLPRCKPRARRGAAAGCRPRSGHGPGAATATTSGAGGPGEPSPAVEAPEETVGLVPGLLGGEAGPGRGLQPREGGGGPAEGEPGGVRALPARPCGSSSGLGSRSALLPSCRVVSPLLAAPQNSAGSGPAVPGSSPLSGAWTRHRQGARSPRAGVQHREPEAALWLL